MNDDPKGNFIMLPNSIYDDLSISNEEVTVFVLMYKHYQLSKSIGLCSIQAIASMMKIDTSNNRGMVLKIKESMKGLTDKNYIIKFYDLSDEEITFEEATSSKDSLFQIELIRPPEDHFFKLYDKDIIHIFNQLHGENISKFNIIRYFIACKRVSHNTSNFGYLTQGKLKKLITDSRTIQRYNKILQDDLHLIRYNNSYLTPDKHYCTTFIGNWDDEVNFNYQLQIEVSAKGLIYTDKIKSNIKRSVKQKINNILSEKDIKIKELEEKLKQYEELQYKEKELVKENEFVEPIPKGIGLQNKKPLPLPIISDDNDDDEPDIFEDPFEDDNDNYWNIELTTEEQKSLQEIEELNRSQIPIDVLQQIEDELNERNKREEDDE